ncbi:high affinity immunoglobulin gamma Fc receptor I-like [Perca fluviatilis]|uniref:high affinity immunoglobulin gamma Fc receptor I-like n=1 Tax=Perca fluviatilis TaxID=8168 RepID=UPI001962E2CD|nr:high affinity immunoglobulin gamma Fc receptor I-like [Perca fluviatilis]
MEVTPLCIRLLMTMLLLLVAQVDYNYSQKADASFPRVVPNRQQHFEYESIVVSCEGLEGLTGWRVMRKIQGVTTTCSSTWSTSTGPCKINNAFPAIDIGEYWCEMGVKKSNTVNITVTVGSVILESPVLPVMEGEAVTLSCRQKQTSTNLTTQFFKDGHLMEKSSTGIMTIHSVSKSFEGLYKCRNSGAGESPESWLAVRAGSVILESPVLPVKEGNNVTMTCRKETAFYHLPADFYKDGRLIRSSSTGEMTIHSVSKSDEGLYKCSISGAGESPESWLAVRAPHRETCPFSDHFIYVLLILRTVFTIAMVALLLLLVGLLHSGNLRVKHK